MSSHATPDSGYGRNFDGSAGDVLERLKLLLDSTPPHALATRPVRRALLEATYVALILGIGGLLGFVLVAAGAAGGM